MTFDPCPQCNATGVVHVHTEPVRCGLCQGHGCVEVRRPRPQHRPAALLPDHIEHLLTIATSLMVNREAHPDLHRLAVLGWEAEMRKCLDDLVEDDE